MNQEEEKAEVGLYLRRAQAEDRALVILALGLPYWIIPNEGLYSLVVRECDAPAVEKELAAYEKERLTTPKPEAVAKPRFRLTPLMPFATAWVMGLCFLIQESAPSWWIEAGAANSRRIMSGEVWRTFTALTLHADLGHLLANTVVGLIFVTALFSWFGFGWTALGAVLSGGLGNLLNALLHSGTPHSSIGASTAVFGCLGLLVGWQTWALLHQHRTSRRLRRRELFVPIGAGLALLAYLGSGDEGSRVDTMAHLFGLLAGTLLGLVAGWRKLPERTPATAQKYLALLALLLLVGAWGCAFISLKKGG